MVEKASVMTMWEAESMFFGQLEQPGYHAIGENDKGTGRREVESLVAQLEQKRITPRALVDQIRKRFGYRGWQDFFFFQNDAIETFLRGAGIAVEVPYSHLPVVRALLPPLSRLVESIERSYKTQGSLCNIDIPFPDPIYLSMPEEAATVDDFVKVPSRVREKLSTNVRVMVIDSGIDFIHKDLSHIPRGNCMDFSGDDDPMDYNGHGTHCSAIVGGRGIVDHRYVGVAPGVDLYHGKVDDGEGHCRLESILSAIDWAIGEEIPIVSMSIGGNGSSILTDLFEEISIKCPILICCSAGNEGMDQTTGEPRLESIGSPADAKHVVAVGAVDSGRKLAPFSSKGSPNPLSHIHGKPDVCALGVKVMSCKSAHNIYSHRVRDSYMTMSGTSMAAPYVAGVAAIIYGAVGDAVPQDKRIARVRQLLFDGSDTPLNDKGAPYAFYEVGHGIPDLPKILAHMGYSVDMEEDHPPVQDSREDSRIPLGRRFCDWTGIPIGMEWKEGIDYYLCEDRFDAYVSAIAFEQYKSHTNGRIVSKEFLLKEYIGKYMMYREQNKEESFVRQRQIALFKQNIEAKYKRAEYSKKVGVMQFKKVFFIEGSPPADIEFTAVFQALVKDKKQTRLYALVWEAFNMDKFPQADEFHLAGEVERENLRFESSGRDFNYFTLTEGEFEGSRYWLPKGAADMVEPMFVLEDPNARRRRCMDALEKAFSAVEAIGRGSLHVQVARTLVEEFGEEYLLRLNPGFCDIVKNDGNVVIKRKG